MSPLATAWCRLPDLCCRVALLALALLAGCSLAIDPDRPQCRADADCSADRGYVCTASLCTRSICGSDQDCARLGAGLRCQNTECAPPTCIASSACGAEQVCDLSESACTARSAAVCRRDEDCQRYEGMGRCEAGLCTSMAMAGRGTCNTAADCPGASPTKECRANVCVDPIWGCTGQPDERPAGTAPTATLLLRALDIYQKPIPGLRIRACDPPWLDPNCDRPTTGTQTKYDDATGEITVSNIAPESKSFRIAIDPPDVLVMGPFGKPTKVMPMDYYTQRTMRDVVDERGHGLVMVTQDVATAWVQQARPGAAVNLASGHLVSRIWDCNGTAAAGVSLATTPPQPQSIPLYINDDGLVSTTAQETDPAGSASLTNLNAGERTDAIATAGKLKVSDFRFIPISGRLTFVNLYPRIYQ